MKDDDKVIKIEMLRGPHPLWEWAAYLGGLLLFVATILNPGSPVWPGILTGMFMYWNYRLFVFIKEWVRFHNTNTISDLLVRLAEEEKNKHKDGTISVHDGLTKESHDDSEQG